MEITEVRIFPRESEDHKLKAYATITIDNAFVVRNVKVIDGNKGLFVAMPSRKLREACPKCGGKNAVRSKFCNQCGSSLPPYSEKRPEVGEEAKRQSGHRDIAHPITPQCREYIQKKVLSAYESEAKRGGSPAPAEAAARPRPERDRDAYTPPPPKEKIQEPQPGHPDVDNDEDFEGDIEL